jgi:hypothetical protein
MFMWNKSTHLTGSTRFWNCLPHLYLYLYLYVSRLHVITLQTNNYTHTPPKIHLHACNDSHWDFFLSTKYIFFPAEVLMPVYVLAAQCIGPTRAYACTHCLPGPFACPPNPAPLHRTCPPIDLWLRRILFSQLAIKRTSPGLYALFVTGWVTWHILYVQNNIYLYMSRKTIKS